MIELCQKPSQRRVLVAALPGGDDLFLLPLAHEWDEDEVVGIVKAVGAVAGQERDPLLRRDHHQDAFGVRRAEENVRLVARLGVALHEKGVAVGIGRGVGRHI